MAIKVLELLSSLNELELNKCRISCDI